MAERYFCACGGELTHDLVKEVYNCPNEGCPLTAMYGTAMRCPHCGGKPCTPVVRLAPFGTDITKPPKSDEEHARHYCLERRGCAVRIQPSV